MEFQSPKYQKNNYSKYYTLNSSLIVKIDKILKPSKFYYKYEAKILQVNQKKVKGEILINIDRKYNNNTFKVDDILLINSKLIEVNKALNPNEFDYKKFLKKFKKTIDIVKLIIYNIDKERR
jgi:competence protein ComEC